MTSRKSFFAGSCLGMLLGPLLLFALAFASTFLFRDAYIQYFAKGLKAPKLSTGAQADFSWKANKLDGTPVDIAALRGKAVFLNFWSPDCSHCESELGAVEKLYQQCFGFGVEFLCVAVGDAAKVAALAQQYNLTVPVAVMDGPRPEVFASTSYPLTFFLAPTGDIALRISGAAKWDAPEVADLLKFLATNKPGSE
jgi:peroxiredoxin